MTNLARYTSADLPALMDRITRNSIGMDEYFDRRGAKIRYRIG